MESCLGSYDSKMIVTNLREQFNDGIFIWILAQNHKFDKLYGISKRMGLTASYDNWYSPKSTYCESRRVKFERCDKRKIYGLLYKLQN